MAAPLTLNDPVFLQIFVFKVHLSITELVYEVTAKDGSPVDIWLDSFVSRDYLLL